MGKRWTPAEAREFITDFSSDGKRGETNEMQRGWHPTGKVLGNVVGGIVGKLRGENLMQNGPGGEEKRETSMMQNGGEKRETSMMQNGGEKRETSMMQNEEEKRSNMMQNGGEKRVCVTPG